MKKKQTWSQKQKEHIQELNAEIMSTRDMNFRLNQQIAMLIDKAKYLERAASGPPIVMEACRLIVQATAHQVTDMLQYVKEIKHR
uniref:Uncharacterized protein n=1 Tax=viral metagenome TaxID=1070528 RepID=A0A6M3KI91_9ZZZZ